MSYPLQQLKDIHPGPPPAANILTGVVSLALVFILLAGVCFLCYRLWPLLRAYGQLRRLSPGEVATPRLGARTQSLAEGNCPADMATLADSPAAWSRLVEFSGSNRTG